MASKIYFSVKISLSMGDNLEISSLSSSTIEFFFGADAPNNFL
jgi:hypothetical protein